MTTLIPVEDNEFFTCGILSHENGCFRPFYQEHNKEDDFQESEVCESENDAYLSLVSILIQKLDEELSVGEDIEDNELEPSVSLLEGQSLRHLE